MPATITCHYCGKTLPRNPCAKNQKYCSSAACQSARKRKHDKNTNSTARGKALKQVRNKRWRDRAPAHEYMHKYREDNPDYESDNREKQLERNKKRHQKDPPSMIVKTDALLLQPSDDGSYMAFKVKKQKIVKTDTLLLQMHSRQGIEADLPQKPG